MGDNLLQIMEEEEHLSPNALLFDDDIDPIVRPPSNYTRYPNNELKAAFTRTPTYMASPDEDDNGLLKLEGTNVLLKLEGTSVLITEVQTSDFNVEEYVGEEGVTNEYVTEDKQYESEEEASTICETVGFPKSMIELSMSDDADYDTDLAEVDDEDDDKTISNYKSVCEQLGQAPVEYFLRHMQDRNITMRYRGLGPEATKAIALSLRDNVTLLKLDISGNWIGIEGSRLVCRLLEENDYITELVLAENKIGSEGALHVAKMIQINTGLKEVDISGNQLDDKCAEVLSSALATNKYLRELNLSHNNFTEVGAQFLGCALGANENLDVLNLSWNHLRDRGGVEIAKGLKENIRLKVCNLSWNGLANEGGLAVADALTINQSLKELDISGNRLTQAVATKLAKVLTTNDSIEILKLGNNLITSAGAIALASAINNTVSCELLELDLTDVPVDYEFSRTIEDIKMKKSDFKVKHGPIMRAGNTTDDLSKPGIDIDVIRKQPVVVLKEHIVVNDMRVIEILKRYDKDKSLSIAVSDFFQALEELNVPYDKKRLQESVQKFHGGAAGKIYFGSILSDDQSNDEPHDDVT